ncbi:hypothetical protein IAT38_007082 [Cryptococcus sp. DSM 104549]
MPPHNTIGQWVDDFPLDDLNFIGKATRTTAPNRTTFIAFHGTLDRGIRVVYDSSVNIRLSAALERELRRDEPVTSTMELHAATGRAEAARETVRDEMQLSAVMRTSFFRRSSDAIQCGLPPELNGRWDQCQSYSGSASDWEFSRPPSNGADKVIALVKLKVPQVLSEDDGSEDSGSRQAGLGGAVEDAEDVVGGTEGDDGGRDHQNAQRPCPATMADDATFGSEGGGDDDADQGHEGSGHSESTDDGSTSDDEYVYESRPRREDGDGVHLRLSLGSLLEMCQRDGGLRLSLVEKKAGNQMCLAVCAVDEEGYLEPGCSHWAAVLAPLWEQLIDYHLELVSLSFYNAWIPFERDSQERNILRMGKPIYRTSPGITTPAGELSPFKLIMAAVIPRPPTVPLCLSFKRLPVAKLSKAVSGQLATKNQQRERKWTAQMDSGAAEHGPRKGTVPLENRSVVRLRVSMPPERHRDVVHFYLQQSIDDAEISGQLFSPTTSPGTATSPVTATYPVTTASPVASTSPVTPTDTPLPLLPLPLAKPPASDVSLTLVRYLGSGRLWDSYHADLTGESLVTRSLVAKVTCPGTYDEGKERTEYLFENSQAAMRAYRRETSLYRGPLAGLQGEAVPSVYGSFEGAMCLSLGMHGGFKIFIELMEDVGLPAAGKGDLLDLPLSEKLQIQSLYRQLHDARVLHRDIQPRHIRRRSDGRFALIDFDSSREVKVNSKGDKELAAEMRLVENMLGLVRRKAKPRGIRQ